MAEISRGGEYRIREKRSFYEKSQKQNDNDRQQFFFRPVDLRLLFRQSLFFEEESCDGDDYEKNTESRD